MNKNRALLGLFILVGAVALIVFFVTNQQGLFSQAQAPGVMTPSPIDSQPSGVATPSPMITQSPGKAPSGPVISRNAPAFSSSGYNPASYANDPSYDTSWRSQGTPAWLAYDLS